MVKTRTEGKSIFMQVEDKNIKLNQYVKKKEQCVRILKPSNLNIKKRIIDEGDFTCYKGQRSVKSSITSKGLRDQH